MKRIIRSQVKETIWLNRNRFIVIEAYKLWPPCGYKNTYEPSYEKDKLFNEIFTEEDFLYFSPAQDYRPKSLLDSLKKRKPKEIEKNRKPVNFDPLLQHGPFHINDYIPELYKKISKKQLIKDIQNKLRKKGHDIPKDFHEFFDEISDDSADFYFLKMTLENHKHTGFFELLEEFYEWIIVERSVPYIFIITLGIE